MKTNLYEQFIDETGQWLRFTSWKFHKDLDKKTIKEDICSMWSKI